MAVDAYGTRTIRPDGKTLEDAYKKLDDHPEMRFEKVDVVGLYVHILLPPVSFGKKIE
jgi:hypothetical protein